MSSSWHHTTADRLRQRLLLLHRHSRHTPLRWLLAGDLHSMMM
jgi:hypothetical protein